MRSADIWLVVGTRPEAIKLSPIAAALTERGISPTLVVTGQHPALDPAEYAMAQFDRVDLACPGLADPNAHAVRVRQACVRAMRPKPDLIMVQGDTSSAYGAALAGFDSGVPVAHVEAGLRTHDVNSPWPEELYRVAIDSRATLLFAPTETAAGNLRHEPIRGAVFVTGNSGIDALFSIERDLPPPRLRERGRPQLLVTCHRRESWASGLAAIATAVRTIAARGVADVRFVLHPNPHVEAMMRGLLDRSPGVSLVAPCGHAAMLEMIREADLLLSDSGGMQEEAPALGVPLLVLRDTTERPEGLASGNSILVGTDPQRIVAEVERLVADPVAMAAMRRRAFPFGDGRASIRIAALIEAWLNEERMRA